MLKMQWKSRVAADFASLIDAIPVDALNSPRRSVVPLVDLFRVPERGLTVLGGALELQLTTATNLVFESALPVLQGEGNASYTDLLVLCPTASLAIEAKFTEPRYENVQTWLGTPKSSNRTAVLNGWLSLISDVTRRKISIESVHDLPYQLIHRTASACAPNVESRALAYLIFGDNPETYYAEDVRALDALLGSPSSLSMGVVHVPIVGSKVFSALTNRWDAGERKMGEDVRRALLQGQLFDFGAPQVL